jgi:hypothetical protein
MKTTTHNAKFRLLFRCLFTPRIRLVIARRLSLLLVSLAFAASPADADSVQNIVSGAGKVMSKTPSAKPVTGLIYVFEENHGSIRGQVQIATMLTRLCRREGLRNVGLEGSLLAAIPLPTKTFLKGENPIARREALRRMFVDCDIRSTEYVGAANPEIALWGLEKKEEYEVQPPSGISGLSGNFIACVLISNELLPRSTLQKRKQLFHSGKYEELSEVMKAGDLWLKEQLTVKDDAAILLQNLIAQQKAIQTKADSLGVELPQKVKDEIKETIHFYEVAEHRSVTLASNMTDLARRFPGAPTALVIGAAHSKQVMEELAKREMNAILIQPLNLNPSTNDAGFVAFQLKNKGLLASISSNSIGYYLNKPAIEALEKSNKRPPETFIGHPTPTRDALGSIQYATSLIAEAARGGRKIPSDIPEVLKALPGGVSIDPNSFSKSGYDVIYCVFIDEPGKEKRRFWIRTGTVNRATKRVEVDSLENDEKLLAAADGEPPRDPPKDQKSTESDGEDPNRKNNDGKKDGSAKEGKSDASSAELSLADIEVVAKAFDDQKAASACPMLSSQ